MIITNSWKEKGKKNETYFHEVFDSFGHNFSKKPDLDPAEIPLSLGNVEVNLNIKE